MTPRRWWRLLSWVLFPLAVLGWLPALPAYLNRAALWLARQLARPYLHARQRAHGWVKLGPTWVKGGRVNRRRGGAS
jgi:hypothetical protein